MRINKNIMVDETINDLLKQEENQSELINTLLISYYDKVQKTPQETITFLQRRLTELEERKNPLTKEIEDIEKEKMMVENNLTNTKNLLVLQEEEENIVKNQKEEQEATEKAKDDEYIPYLKTCPVFLVEFNNLTDDDANKLLEITTKDNIEPINFLKLKKLIQRYGIVELQKLIRE